jgi:carbon-monoxide dehydrogenase large subunit
MVSIDSVSMWNAAIMAPDNQPWKFARPVYPASRAFSRQSRHGSAWDDAGAGLVYGDGQIEAALKFGIGQSVTRREDPRLLRGEGRYVDDIEARDCCHAIVVRCPHAFAEIRAIATDEAASVPGVVAVLTGADCVADGLGRLTCHVVPHHLIKGPAAIVEQPILHHGRAPYVGAPVAVVVAEDKDTAKDAAERLIVEYAEIDPVVEPGRADASGSTPIWPEAERNTAFLIDVGDAATVDAAFARAPHVAAVELVNNRIAASPLEPRGAIGSYDSGRGRYTLRTSTQRPHSTRGDMAAVLGVPESRVRVIAGSVGGGFGIKGAAYPEEALVLWAARRTGRPVKWVSDRTEGFLSDCHGRDQVVTAELALDDAGRILALRVGAVFNQGAYMSGAGGIPPMDASTLVSGVYRIPAVHSRTRAVYTNTVPTHPYRGAGRPEAAYLIECLIDRAARDIGIDPVEMRRRNLIRPADMPFANGLGHSYDCGAFEAVMDEALARAGRDGFETRRADSERRGRRRGFGLALCLESAVELNEQMEIRFEADGSVRIIAGTFSHGQGLETVFAQMVSEWLGVPFEDIDVIQGDTDAVAFGRGTFASRSVTVGGGALRRAADDIITRGRRLAGHVLETESETIVFADGHFTVEGSNLGIAIADVARAAFDPFLPDDLGLGLQATASFASPQFNYPNSCQIAEVEIDPETGAVRLDRCLCVADVGTVLNPLLLEGQLAGGMVQGIGQALLENVVYDTEAGQLLSASFMDYAMPRADDVPSIPIGTHPVPTATNALGVKGAGEVGTVGATPAVMSAILDALSPLGVRHLDMPATPGRVWQAIQDAKSGA